MIEGQGSSKNPLLSFVVQSDPRFTNAGVDDDIEFGGELKQMNFKLLVYQHGDHMKAVTLALWAFVEVDGEGEKKKMER